MSDPFLSVKAQLDNQAKHWADHNDRLVASNAFYRTVLAEIAGIQPDNAGNGLRLAIKLAEDAIRAEGL